MPAAGGLKKSELYLESPQKCRPLLRHDFAFPVLVSVDPLIRAASYTLLWKRPPLSAGVFIWSNVCILCWLLGFSLLLTSTLTLFLIYLNLVMLEYQMGKTNLFETILQAITRIPAEEYKTLPGSSSLSSILANMVNSLGSVFYNLQHSSKTSQTSFWFSICSIVAMITLLCAYCASTTTIIFLYWCLFSLPAVKYHQLHKHLTQQQIANVVNMTAYMVYNSYLAVCQALSASEDTNTAEIEGAFDTNLNRELDREMSEPAESMRYSTMSYLRGLPSVMTLNWRGGLATLFSRGKSPPTVASISTEEDSDYGIDEIEEERIPSHPRSQTLDSDMDMKFPSIDRKNTLDEGTLTMSGGLDPELLFDEDQSEFSVGTGMSDFTLGRGLAFNPLDAVISDSDDDLDVGKPSGANSPISGTECSPTPPFGSSITSDKGDKSDTLNGRQFMLNIQPTRPEDPKPEQSYRERLRNKSKEVEDEEDGMQDFYLVSETDIKDAEDELERSLGSIASSVSSVGSAIAGRIRRLSDKSI